MTEVLPEVAKGAGITMLSTLFSISLYPPFSNGAHDYFENEFSPLGVDFRQAVLESQQSWFKKMETNNMVPLVFAKEALSAFDDVFSKYSSEIDLAHDAMMKFYQDRPMPIRTQDGFNWVKLW